MRQGGCDPLDEVRCSRVERFTRSAVAWVYYDPECQSTWSICDWLPMFRRGGHALVVSQACALAGCAPVDQRRDAAALTGFYLWGHGPEPFSWWAGISMFPAGHVQRICVGRSLAPPQAFARVHDGYIRQTSRPVMAGELRKMMLDSVRHHLVADVDADLRHPSTSRIFNLDNQKGLVPGEIGRAFHQSDQAVNQVAHIAGRPNHSARARMLIHPGCGSLSVLNSIRGLVRGVVARVCR